MQWLKNPDARDRMAAVGMVLSALDQGRTADVSAIQQRISDRQGNAAFQEYLQTSGVLDQFTPEQKQMLSMLPQQAAMRILAEQVFREPEKVDPMDALRQRKLELEIQGLENPTVDPMDAIRLEKAQIELNNLKNPTVERKTAEGADGYLYYLDTRERVFPNVQAAPDPTAAEAKIQRIMTAYGVDERTATGIVDGVLTVSRDPYTDQIQITNLATNESWTPSTPNAQPEVRTAPPESNFEEPFQGATEAFGAEGLLKRGANFLSDLVAGQEVFPEAGGAQRDFSLLRENLTQTMQGAYGQRLPSWMLQALRDLTPAPGTMQGAGSAQGQLNALGRQFENELNRIESGMRANHRTMSPEAKAEARSQAGAMRRALAQINAALEAFNEGADISKSDQDLINKWLQ